MTFRFGQRSMKNLSECHPELQRLFAEVIKHIDCAVIDGHRGEKEQMKLFHAGLTKLKWNESKHNKLPSMAVDVVPYLTDPPHIDWKDLDSFYHFVGYVRGIASQLGIKIRCGADWDGDNSFKDQTFHDLAHFELIEDEE